VERDAIRIQREPVYVGSERPWDHAHQGLSMAGWNDSSAGSVGASAVLGATSSKDTPRKRLTKNSEMNGRNEGDDSVIVMHSACRKSTAMTFYMPGDGLVINHAL
jgi:hypothetical protein